MVSRWWYCWHGLNGLERHASAPTLKLTITDSVLFWCLLSNYFTFANVLVVVRNSQKTPLTVNYQFLKRHLICPLHVLWRFSGVLSDSTF